MFIIKFPNKNNVYFRWSYTFNTEYTTTATKSEVAVFANFSDANFTAVRLKLEDFEIYELVEKKVY